MSIPSPQLVAGGDIYPCRFVKLSTTADFTVLQADANAVVIGVAQGGGNQPPLSDYVTTIKAATSGQPVNIHGDGEIVLVEAGGNITRGAQLISDANGKAVPAATTGTTVQNIAGVALQSGSSGEKIMVLVTTVRHLRPAVA